MRNSSESRPRAGSNQLLNLRFQLESLDGRHGEVPINTDGKTSDRSFLAVPAQPSPMRVNRRSLPDPPRRVTMPRIYTITRPWRER
jgi:hypothetical protein